MPNFRFLNWYDMVQYGSHLEKNYAYDTLSAIVYIICPLCHKNYEQLLIYFITLYPLE